MLPPGCAAHLLLGDPGEYGLSSIALVTAERDVGKMVVPRVLAHPALRHGEEICDFAGGEEAVAHAASRDPTATTS